MQHICVSESSQHWLRKWLIAYSAPSHYLNQCWVIVTWTHRNKLQRIHDHGTKNSIHENASENIVCEMAAILSRRRWVKSTDAIVHNGTRPSTGPLLTISLYIFCSTFRWLSVIFNYIYWLEDLMHNGYGTRQNTPNLQYNRNWRELQSVAWVATCVTSEVCGCSRMPIEPSVQAKPLDFGDLLVDRKANYVWHNFFFISIDT